MSKAKSNEAGLIRLFNTDGTPARDVIQYVSTSGNVESPAPGGFIPSSGGGSGTVSSVAVASANGFAGTVANPTTTPTITIDTTITGVLKGNGTAISAASAGTDYQAPVTLTTTGSGAATLISNTLNIPTPAAASIPYVAGSGTATAAGTNAFAAGTGATASSTRATAIGDGATASTASDTLAVGSFTTASAAGSTALGSSSGALGAASVALGSSASAAAVNDIAIGTSANTTGSGNSVAIGNGTTAATGGVAIGNSITVVAGATNVGGITKDATGLKPLFTTSLAGTVPASGGGTTNFLRADGTWAAPATTGLSLTITTAQLTVGGVQGSMTFTNGLLTAQTAAT